MLNKIFLFYVWNVFEQKKNNYRAGFYIKTETSKLWNNEKHGIANTFKQFDIAHFCEVLGSFGQKNRTLLISKISAYL